MEIAPILGLELALETVRRVAAAPAPGAPHAAAGEAPASSGLSAEESRGPAAAMRELQALLHERRIGFHVTGPDGRELRSAPPMQRRPMIAEEMDITPLRSALKKFFRKLSGQTPDKGKGRTP
jgi:hypothetical protein